MDEVVVGPERDGDPGADRSQPELLAAHAEVPAGRHDPLELHRPTPVDHRGGGASASCRIGSTQRVRGRSRCARPGRVRG